MILKIQTWRFKNKKPLLWPVCPLRDICDQKNMLIYIFKVPGRAEKYHLGGPTTLTMGCIQKLLSVFCFVRLYRKIGRTKKISPEQYFWCHQSFQTFRARESQISTVFLPKNCIFLQKQLILVKEYSGTNCKSNERLFPVFFLLKWDVFAKLLNKKQDFIPVFLIFLPFFLNF